MKSPHRDFPLISTENEHHGSLAAKNLDHDLHLCRHLCAVPNFMPAGIRLDSGMVFWD